MLSIELGLSVWKTEFSIVCFLINARVVTCACALYCSLRFENVGKDENSFFLLSVFPLRGYLFFFFYTFYVCERDVIRTFSKHIAKHCASDDFQRLDGFAHYVRIFL